MSKWSNRFFLVLLMGVFLSCKTTNDSKIKRESPDERDEINRAIKFSGFALRGFYACKTKANKPQERFGWYGEFQKYELGSEIWGKKWLFTEAQRQYPVVAPYLTDILPVYYEILPQDLNNVIDQGLKLAQDKINSFNQKSFTQKLEWLQMTSCADNDDRCDNEDMSRINDSCSDVYLDIFILSVEEKKESKKILQNSPAALDFNSVRGHLNLCTFYIDGNGQIATPTVEQDRMGSASEKVLDADYDCLLKRSLRDDNELKKIFSDTFG